VKTREDPDGDGRFTTTVHKIETKTNSND